MPLFTAVPFSLIIYQNVDRIVVSCETVSILAQEKDIVNLQVIRAVMAEPGSDASFGALPMKTRVAL